MGIEFEMETLWGCLACLESPEVHRELTGNGHDGLLTQGTGGSGTLTKNMKTFTNGRIVGLKAHHTPSQLHKSATQPGVAMLGDTPLNPLITTAVLSGAKACVAGNLSSVFEASPVTDLPSDGNAGEFTHSAGDLLRSAHFEFTSEGRDLGLEGEEDWTSEFQLRDDPGREMLLKASPSLRLPPVGGCRQIEAYQERATLSLESGAMTHQGIALTALVPELFFLLPGNTDDSQGMRVTLQIPVESQAEGTSIPSIGFDAGVALIELLRGEDHAVSSQRVKFTAETKAEATGFVDGMDRVSLEYKPLHPSDELFPKETLWRSW